MWRTKHGALKIVVKGSRALKRKSQSTRYRPINQTSAPLLCDLLLHMHSGRLMLVRGELAVGLVSRT